MVGLDTNSAEIVVTIGATAVEVNVVEVIVSIYVNIA